MKNESYTNTYVIRVIDTGTLHLRKINWIHVARCELHVLQTAERERMRMNWWHRRWWIGEPRRSQIDSNGFHQTPHDRRANELKQVWRMSHASYTFSIELCLAFLSVFSCFTIHIQSGLCSLYIVSIIIIIATATEWSRELRQNQCVDSTMMMVAQKARERDRDRERRRE